MDIQAALRFMEKQIETGNIIKTKIEVDGQSVSLDTLSEKIKYYEYLKGQAAQAPVAGIVSPYSRGRVVVGDPGDGLR